MVKKVFPGRYDALANIAEFIQTAVQESNFNSFDAYAVETAVDEACSNIIEHAYGGEDIGTIECSYEINLQGLTIVLVDHGRPFNPQQIPSPKINSELSRRHAHGLGLYMIRQWMDEVKFEFGENENRLTLVKYRGIKE